MIEITEMPISPERVVSSVKSGRSGCVVTYICLIREYSQDNEVLSVEYRDPEGNARDKLGEMVRETQRKWHVNGIAMVHRIGRLKVGEVNLVVAVSSAHRGEGFAACQYLIDRFKERLPTRKTGTYLEVDAQLMGPG